MLKIKCVKKRWNRNFCWLAEFDTAITGYSWRQLFYYKFIKLCVSDSICEDVSHNNDDDHNIYTVSLSSFSSISQDNDISFERITKNPACGSNTVRWEHRLWRRNISFDKVSSVGRFGPFISSSSVNVKVSLDRYDNRVCLSFSSRSTA